MRYNFVVFCSILFILAAVSDYHDQSIDFILQGKEKLVWRIDDDEALGRRLASSYVGSDRDWKNFKKNVLGKNWLISRDDRMDREGGKDLEGAEGVFEEDGEFEQYLILHLGPGRVLNKCRFIGDNEGQEEISLIKGWCLDEFQRIHALTLEMRELRELANQKKHFSMMGSFELGDGGDDGMKRYVLHKVKFPDHSIQLRGDLDGNVFELDGKKELSGEVDLSWGMGSLVMDFHDCNMVGKYVFYSDENGEKKSAIVKELSVSQLQIKIVLGKSKGTVLTFEREGLEILADGDIEKVKINKEKIIEYNELLKKRYEQIKLEKSNTENSEEGYEF